jgi:hypothetical protein
MRDGLRFVEALEDEGAGGRVAEGMVDGCGPICLRDVVSDGDASGAPGIFGEAASFEDELAFFLGEEAEFVP